MAPSSRPRTAIDLPCALILALLIPTLLVAATPTLAARLAPPAPAALPTGQPRLLAEGPVTEAVLSATGQHVVFTKDTARAEAGVSLEQLFSIPFAGGTATPLMASPAPETGLVEQILLTPDGARVVFLVRAQPEGQTQLYSAPIAGGAVTRLNGDLAPGSSVTFAQLTPDSASVVFSTGPLLVNGSGPSELFVASVQGGTPRRVHAPLSGSQSLSEWRLSQDGSRVVYTLLDGEPSNPLLSLQAAPISGGESTVLATHPANEHYSFAVSPNGSTVLYSLAVERPNLGTGRDLFKVAATGGTPVNITPATGGVFNFTYTISPDSAYAVVYVGGNGNPDLQDLYSVPLAGGQPVRLDPFLGDADAIQEYLVSPDSSRVLFRATDTNFRSSLYSVPMSGGAPVTFAPQQPSGPGIGAPFYITPNSARVVFYEGRQYLSAPLAGGAAPITIADDINSSTGKAYGTNHFITADGAHLFFRGQVVGESTFPLFAVPISGAGPLQKLSGDIAVVTGLPVAGFGSPIGFQSSRSGAQVIFRGADSQFNPTSLYAVGELPGTTPVKDKLLHLPLVRR